MKKKEYKNLFAKIGLGKNSNKKTLIDDNSKDKSVDFNEFTKELVVVVDKNEKNEKIIFDDYKLPKLVELEHVYLWYKKFNKIKKIIFDDLNFTIYEGQIIAIVGQNGVGKTTLFEIITQIRKINKGKIIFPHEDAKKDPTKYIGMQTQDFVFPSGLTVKDVVEFILELQQIDITDEIGEFKRMLKIFQLDALWNEKASKLSGGQQQRLNLFISLLNHPKILLLDEYATGLDIKSKELIESFIMSYIKIHHITLVFISHELGGLTQMANRYVIINNKNIMVDLPVDKVNNLFGSVTNLIKYYIN